MEHHGPQLQDRSDRTADRPNGGAGTRRIDLRSVVLLAAGMACFGSATPVSAIVGQGFPSWLGSALRMAVAAVCLLPVAIGAVLFLRDRLDGRRAAAVALAVIGVVLVNVGADVSQGRGQSIVLGSALVFAAVVCEASYTLLGKRLSADLTPLTMVTVAAVLALVLFLPLALWDASGFDWSAPTAGQWLAVGWWGVGTIHAAGLAIVLAGLVLVVRSGASVH